MADRLPSADPYVVIYIMNLSDNIADIWDHWDTDLLIHWRTDVVGSFMYWGKVVNLDGLRRDLMLNRNEWQKSFKIYRRKQDLIYESIIL